jgi:hypothetical protein
MVRPPGHHGLGRGRREPVMDQAGQRVGCEALSHLWQQRGVDARACAREDFERLTAVAGETSGCYFLLGDTDR